MRAARLSLLVVLAGCGALQEWPSLSQRPAEAGGGLQRPDGPATAEAVAADAPIDRAALMRELDKAETDWSAQAARLDAALPSSGGPLAAGGTAWAEAEVELSRLEVIGTALEDIARRTSRFPDPNDPVAVRATEAVARHRAAVLAAGAKLGR